MSADAADLVNGRYRLLEVIGAGGMGRVWLAADELLDRRVAIKEIVPPDGVTGPELIDAHQRTMREARAAARLDHPGVVRVFDVVWRPGQAWIVMEYVQSRSLHQTVAADGPRSHREAARIGLAVLSALRAAHAVGVFHRDVKPHNVLLAEDGRVVLGDFGLATFEGAEGPDPLMGSAHFVAPERLRGAAADAPADLWSLATTLYAATEGVSPFARETTSRTLTAVLSEPPTPPAHPGPLTPVITALLAKDPAQRMTAAQAEPHLRRIATRFIGAFPVPVSRPAEAPRRPPRRGRVAAGAAGALLAAVVGTALVVNGADAPATTVAAALPAPPSDPCGFTAAQTTTAGPGAGTPPFALPAGWIWHPDPAGFALALPAGWNRIEGGGTVCFSDPAGRRGFTVVDAPVAAAPLAYWRAQERAALDAGTLPGYERVDMGVLQLREGGADWEYSWQPAGGARAHVRRVLLVTAADRAFRLGWSTTEQNWSADVATQQRIVSSFQQSA